jgi:SP family arabinose:H+ symporter-like MFS transporter
VLREIVASLQSGRLAGEPAAGSFTRLWSPSFRKVAVMVTVLAMLQQLTGINVIMYYAPNIFASIGVGKSGAILQSVSIGLVMSVFTVVAIVLVDRVGRRQLLQWGALGMTVSLLLLGMAFAAERADTYLVLSLMLAFIACFSVSAGPVIWVLISELLPNEVRSIGTGLAAFFLWMTNYLVTLTFPWLLQVFKGDDSWITFGIYAGFCFLLFLYTTRYVVETKGRTLEEIKELVAAEP